MLTSTDSAAPQLVCSDFYTRCLIFSLVFQNFHSLSRYCYAGFMDIFGDLTTDAIAAHQADIAADALANARQVASAWLATGPGHGLTHDEITDTLIRRNATDPQYQRLAPFEKRWALLVIRLLRNAMDATPAVQDAHHRGASWADIGNALGIARATAFNRFSDTARATRKS